MGLFSLTDLNTTAGNVHTASEACEPSDMEMVFDALAGSDGTVLGDNIEQLPEDFADAYQSAAYAPTPGM